MRKRIVGFVILFLIGLGVSSALAQIPHPSWGISATLAPKWTTPTYLHKLVGADSSTLSGKEFMIGFVRGEARHGEWGVSFLRRTVDEGGVVTRGTATLTVGPSVQMNGVELQKFAPFTTFADRGQIGLAFGLGAGWLQGDLTRKASPGGTTTVQAKELYAVNGKTLPVVPIFRLELVGTVIATPQFKVRFGGGLNYPGMQVFSISATYLIGAR